MLFYFTYKEKKKNPEVWTQYFILLHLKNKVFYSLTKSSVYSQKKKPNQNSKYQFCYYMK